MRRAVVLAALAAAAFATLAGLVAAGTLTSVDQWAVNHLMPGLDPSEEGLPLLYGLLPLAGILDETAIQVALNLFTVLASVVPSAIVVALAAHTRLRRGERRLALAWPAAWLLANAVEVLTKTTLERPALFSSGVHLSDLDHSYPSGHSARALLLAAACASAWPRTRPYVLAWAALVLPALVAAGFHAPSDVAGGALLAALVVGAALSTAFGLPPGGASVTARRRPEIDGEGT